jgi:hypothetical protein
MEWRGFARVMNMGCMASVIILLMIAEAPCATMTDNCNCMKDNKTRLVQRVKDYDNGGAPLIPTLLGIADTYNVPMGIEKVTKEALERPVRVKLQEGTLGGLLDLCVAAVPGYSWALHDDVIHVYGADELTRTSNLFNHVIPSFKIREQTLNAANSGLRMSLTMAKDHPTGIIASHPGSTDFEDSRLTFAAKNATVREILNALVSLYGNSVWIARVPPQRLSQLPQAGLWTILPHSVHDPKGLLEPFPK